MTNEEWLKISGLKNAAIIAPAGHGKTEMIADIVEHSSKRQLLLTHTNAGVDAISKRLKKRNISKDKYSVTTIAAFCVKWCLSYLMLLIDCAKTSLYKKDIRISNIYHRALCCQKVWNLTALLLI